MSNDQASDAAPSEPHPALRRLEPLIGRWEWAGRSTSSDFEVSGWDSFEWLDGGFFLVEKWDFDQSGAAARGLAVTGYDAESESCLTRYFDNGGQYNAYRMDLSGTTLTITWDRYRFSGVLDQDAGTIRGTWEQSPDGNEWNYWYDLIMTKTDSGA